MQSQVQSVNAVGPINHNHVQAHHAAMEAGLNLRQLSIEIESEMGCMNAYIDGLEAAIANLEVALHELKTEGGTREEMIEITQGDMPKAKGLLKVAGIAKASLSVRSRL